jgi:hypothetical protein
MRLNYRTGVIARSEATKQSSAAQTLCTPLWIASLRSQ